MFTRFCVFFGVIQVTFFLRPGAQGREVRRLRSSFGGET